MHPLLLQVEFRVSAAEDMSYCRDSTVDLITAAQSMHWYRLDDFYAEVKRVLRPGGVLAAYGYGLPQLDAPGGTQLINDLFDKQLDGYWHENVQTVNNGYENIVLPLRDFKRYLNFACEFSHSCALYNEFFVMLTELETKITPVHSSLYLTE